MNFFDTETTQNTPLHWVASFADVNTTECLCGKIESPISIIFFNYLFSLNKSCVILLFYFDYTESS